MTEEGFRVVKAVRDRFDGEKRNLWNEFECGSNNARSMASYALIPILADLSLICHIIILVLIRTKQTNSDAYGVLQMLGEILKLIVTM